MARAGVSRVVHLGGAPGRGAPRPGHGVPAAAAAGRAPAGRRARHVRLHRLDRGAAVADRLRAGRRTPAERPRVRVDVGARVQPVRQSLCGDLPDWRRDPVGRAVQPRARHTPSHVGEHADRDRRDSAGDRRHRDAHGLRRGALRHRTGGPVVYVVGLSDERASGAGGIGSCGAGGIGPCGGGAAGIGRNTTPSCASSASYNGIG